MRTTYTILICDKRIIISLNAYSSSNIIYHIAKFIQVDESEICVHVFLNLLEVDLSDH